MASSDLVIGYHKLDTEFFAGHVQHTTFRSDASPGRRQVRVVKKWHREREVGRGSFGTVFLERSEQGEHRAVKEIAKDRNGALRIDYRRELMAMAILVKHDALFVQLFGWYESENYVYIAMEYVSHGHLRNYMQVERSESEAKAITRQLLEGLVVIHQEGFAHRDLKPENIFVVSASPIWVKIGDFGLAKLARDGTAFRTPVFTTGYFAPEAGIATGGDSSEYTNAVDIWAVGCIAHEMLTRTLPFRNFYELSLYCTRPEFPQNSMLQKNISRNGMEIVESMLALSPEGRISAKEALDSEWLRLGDETQEGLETDEDEEQEWWEAEEGLEGPALPEVVAASGAAVASASRQGALANPKPHLNIHRSVKQVLQSALERIQRSTDSPHKPMLSDEGAVHKLLSGVISMDIRDCSGNTPLHIAVVICRFDRDDRIVPGPLRELVASGADINAKNSQGETPLFRAVGYGSSIVVKELLELGANAEEPNLDGIRPLMRAVEVQSRTLVALLLDHGALPNHQGVAETSTPLHTAALLPSNTICQLILRKGANVNARDSLGQTPLHRAVMMRRVEVARSLISAGAYVEARDAEQKTPLFRAVSVNSVPLAKLLLDHGANPDVVQEKGFSPRRLATGEGCAPEMVALFDRPPVTR